eukprot:COSAG04_NODE_514_length_13214_cov_6.456805_5_plen_500_part_00
MMIVGLGGNNGSTVAGALVANKEKLTWETRKGTQSANFYGSITQSSTTMLGNGPEGEECYVPLKSLLPMVEPDDMVIGGWDISSMNLADAMKRSRVFEPELQAKLRPYLESIVPLPAPYYPQFIAANQGERADNVLPGTKAEHVEAIRRHIREFKAANGLDKVVVMWSANTERFCDVQDGLNMSAAELMASIEADEEEVPPSQIFAVACILENAPYINGSPQNTMVPGVVELALQHNVPIAGDDFKSGQTKMKSVLVDFLVGAGIKVSSIVSYNHLGNNDGKNLSAPSQFRSKEISKSNVVDDMVASNRLIYGEDEHPDHCVVIKYVPYVADSKRAMDEYSSEIMMGGTNTITMTNICEDSLLAAPLILDLVILAELSTRMHYKQEGSTVADATAKTGELAAEGYTNFHPVMSLLHYMLKAPFVPEGTPVVNALFRQKSNIENMLRACAGLRPINNMRLDTVHHPAQEAVTKTPPVAATAGKEIDAPETETAAAATAAA